MLTATLCKESKRISVPSLDRRRLKLLQSSNGQPTEQSKPLLYRLGSPLTSARDRRLRRRRSPDSHSRAGRACLAAHNCTSRRWLLRRWPRKHRPCTCRLCAFSFAGWPRRQHHTTGQRRPGIRRWRSAWSGATTRARHRTWPARRLQQCGGRFQTSLEASPPLSIASWAGSDKGTAAAGGSLDCGTQPKTFGSLTLPALRNVHTAVGRTSAARLPPTGAAGKVVTAHPSERAGAAWQNKRVRHQHVTGHGTHQFLFPVLQVLKAT